MLKRMPLIVLVCALVLGVVGAASLRVYLFPPGVAAAAQPETHLMRYPDIARDHMVFSYAGDLWVSPRAGGVARRLTAHPGDEIFAKFSPDGKWIAFTGEYDGNADVYVIPTEGGEPRRLTFHPGNDFVLGWTPDSKKILFRSARASAPPAYTRLFLISLDGGVPELLPVPRASLTSFSPDGQKVALTPTSQEFRTWKRYRGGWSPAIGIYDLKKNTYEQLPKTSGMDMFPMWHGNAIYFISDRDGAMNLYRYDLGNKQTKKLSSYKEYDVKWPSLGPDAIVYENGGLLYSLDLSSEKVTHISVTVNSDDIEARPEIKTVAERIRTFNLSPSGVRAVFEARGEIFTLPVEHGSPRNLTQTPSVHELNPVWSPDGKWIAYLSDRTGEYEIYLRPQKGGDEVRVTSDGSVYRYGPLWAPDNKKLLYWDKKLRLWYVDMDKKEPVLIDQGEYDQIEGGDWSPDSRWVAYAKTGPNLSAAIYLYSLEQKKIFPVTNGFYDDGNPVFDHNGKYLYFLSQRFFYPSPGRFDQRFNYYSTTGVFAVTLKADEASPFAAQSDEEKEAEEKKDEKKADEKKKEANDKKNGAGEAKPPAADASAEKQGEKKTDEKKAEEKKAEEKAPKPVQIDIEGLGQRIVNVPIPAGIYDELQARKEKLFYRAIPMEARQAALPGPPRPRNSLHVYDVSKREDKVLLEGINNYDLNKDGSKVIYRSGDTYGVVDAVPGKAKVGEGKLNTSSLQVLVDPREEWKQIFREAWRIERDFYWDPNMGGLDWKKIGKRYEALLPWVAHRSDLNYIIGEMIAELSTSHTYVGGGEVPDRKRISVGLLGVDFEADQGYYRFKKIYRGENWNDQTRAPLDEPGLKVKESNYLIAVNGVAARSSASPYSYFQNLANQVVTLKVNDKPSAEGAWEINVKPAASEAFVRYLDWVESRRKLVSEATGGRVGYMHVPDTFISGVIMFDKYLNAQIGKDGMIVDERYNAGGQIPDFYTEKLKRGLLSLLAPREGKDVPWPPLAIYGPKVMIINELAGSGGDAFPWFFKREKIGPLVGTRTWGGLIGIARNIPLMDGGFVTAPEFAFWSTDNGGEWIVENHGVDPDHVVEQRPDLEVSGHDPQLEQAIELAKEGLKNYKALPPRPKYPKK
ncbi:MAG: PD40 domain-containing protein [Acidobacteria bacterium]|nr:PD40 domain-containing protein [Acidobacteriota bacterium]